MRYGINPICKIGVGLENLYLIRVCPGLSIKERVEVSGSHDVIASINQMQDSWLHDRIASWTYSLQSERKCMVN